MSVNTERRSPADDLYFDYEVENEELLSTDNICTWCEYPIKAEDWFSLQIEPIFTSNFLFYHDPARPHLEYFCSTDHMKKFVKKYRHDARLIPRGSVR